ncbi:MAG: ATP-binding cassette domain-containing protein [Desulfobacterales bacterium]
MDSVNFMVEKGEFVTIIGSNGAGKSTLLNLIAGTYPPDEGSIRINDKDVTRKPDYKRASYLARVFQNTTMGTAGEMSIVKNFCMAELRGKKRGIR